MSPLDYALLRTRQLKHPLLMSWAVIGYMWGRQIFRLKAGTVATKLGPVDYKQGSFWQPLAEAGEAVVLLALTVGKVLKVCLGLVLLTGELLILVTCWATIPAAQLLARAYLWVTRRRRVRELTHAGH